MWNVLMACLTLFSVYSCENHGQGRLSHLKGEEGLLYRVNDTCVYESESHAAFTSLEEWKGELFLAFREAKAHKATNTDKGKIVILKLSGDKWTTFKTFEMNRKDLRDPYLLKWDNKLLLYTSGYFSFLSEQGWSRLYRVNHNASHPVWIWKIRPYKDKLYGIGYSDNEWPILLSSDNGADWNKVTTFKIGGCASEADMVFVNDKMYICLRIDKPLGSNSMWGCGEYPFTDIKWTMMPVSIASPEMMYLPDQGMLLLSGREYQTNLFNMISSTDVSLLSVNFDGTVNGRLKIDTEKGWDKGYPSFCYHKGKLYMSYYLGNSTQSAVRLSTFNIKNNGK